ncbi:MgtC/SapB family protein [Methylocapsa acidiphila]|uniref:MgtC/SapB family protein n=1 Tax=Methylocapsa acidiphila TaxID=133552 RepID=UPI00040E663E|nr:DUF4010 domain-containing protein [Methylocapsa acidiphila]
MFSVDPLILGLAVALGIGLLIGAERERRKEERRAPASAGIRTFALASLAGALSIVLGGQLLFAVTLGGAFALASFAYWRGFRDDPGLTTEIALVVTILLGGLTMSRPGLAAGVAVAVAIVLAARTALHRFVSSVLGEDELHDALTFAAATLIVLPLLPDRPMGPLAALNPHAIWILVILVMAIGAFGHIAVRLLGPRFGLPLAGLASGFISSVATIGAMGARAAEAPALLWPAAAGAVLSTVATVVQMALLLAVANVATLIALAVPLACAGAAAILYGATFAVWALRGETGAVRERGRAFSLATALTFATMLAAILLGSRALSQWYGERGVLAAAAMAGFADTHSAAISIAAQVGEGQIAAGDATLPILVALSTNSITKLAASLFGGGGLTFALRVVPGLILVISAAWAGWWFVR